MLHLRYADPVYVPTGAASAVAISRDRRYVAVGYNQSPFLSVYPLDHDQMSLGDRIDAPALATPPSQGPRDVEWSPDGRFLFASWPVAPYLVGLEFDPDAGVFTGANSVPSWSLQSYSITFHPTAPYVAMTISGSNGIRLYEYDPDTGTIITSGAQTKPQSGGLYCAWSPNGRLLAASHSNAQPYLSVYPFDPDTGVLSDRLNWSSGSIPTNAANAGLDFNTTGERIVALNSSARELTFFEINPTYGGYISRRQIPITNDVIPNLPGTGGAVHSVTCPDEFHAVIGTSGTLDANIGLHGFTDYLVHYPNVWAQRRTPIPSVAPVGTANRVTKMGNLVAAAMQTPPYIMVYTWQPMGVRITGENDVVYVGSNGLVQRRMEMPYVVQGNHGPAIPLTLTNTTDAILASVELDYRPRNPELGWYLDVSLADDPFEPEVWPLVLQGPFSPGNPIATIWVRARADENATIGNKSPTLTVNAVEVEP